MKNAVATRPCYPRLEKKEAECWQVVHMAMGPRQPQRLVVDRVAHGWAMLEVEARVTLTVPASWLPAEASEGDALLCLPRRRTDL